ncbi:PaaI family thioesterase [Phenylobacterium montanum]|nr:PaaI family thioesterase [Caulobacter sp. S6]
MPPPGFEPFDRESPLLAPWRPIFMRNEPGQVVLGLEAREAHTNSRGTVHGGLYAALADQAMGLSCGARLRAEGAQVEGLWTTSLGIDYLGAARPGQWLEFHTLFVHGGGRSSHAEMDITADGETVARARASFRVALARGAA